MHNTRWIGVLGAAIVVAGWLFSANLHAASNDSDAYATEDLWLQSAGDLLDVCTIEPGHADHEVAMAFCYGFIEGAIHYDEAVSGSEGYKEIVCHPPGVTRSQAVSVVTDYLAANSQYAAEKPVEAIFRALVAKWPCPQ